jgi:2-deoxy-D-gluconate 3-dehydrogenase
MAQDSPKDSPNGWLELDGKVALITGAARGVGRGIAEVLAGLGARVVVADVDAAEAESTAAAIAGKGLLLDVSDCDSVESAVAEVVDEFGSLDILVNNAGVYRDHGGPIVDLEPEVWRRLMAVNLDGVFYCSRAVSRAMIGSNTQGRIVNVASTQAFTPGVGVSYDASKAAVVQFTRTLALELAPHGINVNAVAPGATWVGPGDAPPVGGSAPMAPTGEPLADTVANRIARIPMQRWGQPDDVGRAVAFLVSAMSDYVTGTCLPIDGGWLLL